MPTNICGPLVVVIVITSMPKAGNPPRVVTVAPKSR